MSKGKMNKEEAKQKVRELAQRFRYNLDVYKKSAYNETQVRREFIDPFFEALGWDVENRHGHAEQYKDVVQEARMERDKELYEWQIKIVDAQIDRLVYDLYGLTGGG